MSGWLAAAQIAGEVGTAWLNATAQHKANRTNIQLQREQQAWEQMMSNSAVQRRADDIEKAGGNRALAFVNGSEASTPTLSPARVEPARLNAPNIGTAMMQRQQIENMKANTFKTLQEGRGAKIAADLAEGTYKTELDKRVNRNIEEHEWDDLETEIRRSKATTTAAQAKRWNDTVDALIQMAKQQAAAGKLDLEALQNIAEIGGIEANKMQGIIQLILKVLTK